MVKTNNKVSTMNKHFFVSVLLGITMLYMLATSQNLFAQKMTLTTSADVGRVGFGLAGEGEVTINWGDGKSDSDFLGPNSTTFEHYYPREKSGPWTVTITCANIIHLYCSRNHYTNLDLSKHPELEYLNCQENQLTSLDVSKNIKLKHLNCYDNEIKSLNVSNCSELKVLGCTKNQITTLDVSKNIELEELACYWNNLTSLDVSKNIKLKKLWCQGNQLRSLDVSNNKDLKEVHCAGNKLTYPALNALFESLPENDIKYKVITIYDNSGVNNCDRNIAEKKGWRVSTSD